MVVAILHMEPAVSSVNAWRLQMKITGEKEPYLSFLQELVIHMMTFHGRPPLKRLPGPVTDKQRYDGKNHWIGQLEDGKKSCVTAGSATRY